MRTALLALFLGALLLLAAPATWSHAQTTSASGGPGLVYQSVKDGDVVTEPLFDIQLCFASPINIKDLDKGGDFAFTLTQPDGLGLGHRDVFQPDANGITIYPGPGTSDTAGEWKFTYRITSPDAQNATTGTIKYTVDPSGEERPRATPPSCLASGGTPTVGPGGTPTAGPTTTPSGSAGASATARPSGSAITTPSPAATPVPGESDDSGPDIARLAYLTIGAAGAAAVLLLIGYAIRRAVGFDWHKPGPGDDDNHH